MFGSGIDFPVSKRARVVISFLVGLLCLIASPALASPPAFDVEDPGKALQTDSGVIQLTWKSDDQTTTPQYELEHTPPGSEPFILPTGRDATRVISGLAEGDHRFRVRRAATGELPAGDWSSPLQVKNDFVERSKVVRLLWLGSIVVLATAIAIIHGFFSSRNLN